MGFSAACRAAFRTILWAVLSIAPIAHAHAQIPLDNRRTLHFVAEGDTIRLDTLSVVPGSFLLLQGEQPVDTATYELDPFKALLIRRTGFPTDSLTARFRVMPLLLGGTFSHKDPDRLVMITGERDDPFKYVPTNEREDLFGSTGLNKSGSISRGVLFGNNQDLSVNSSLNLELSGRLTERIQVLASITDNNIPIQADGNTQELRDFDQVFIKLFEETGPRTGWELIAGDFVLQRPRSHFLTYLKKTKGLSGTVRSNLGRSAHNTIGSSVAISKGKFARQLIQGVEGVQGPYRLRGAEGETFIVVLSGTERVFVDGEPLTRGQENDYVIDYNQAEITFTAKRMITKDRRISVEFQYADQNYMRSLVRLDNITEVGDHTIRVHVYSEQDHKGQSLQQSLTDEEKLALAAAGDDPLLAVVPGVDSVAWTPDQVLYTRIDSLGYFPVYRASTDPAEARFRITFSNVGQGRGDYVQQTFTPNGRVFRWVAPDTVNGSIVRRGDHAPLRVLVTPRSQQLIVLGHDHRGTGGARTSAELAWSRYDPNTFSALDDADDQAVGARMLVARPMALSRKDTSLALEWGLETEALQQSFRPVERYRAVEFERNWNALTTPLDGDQLLAAGSLGLRAGKRGRLRYTANTFQVRDRYAGWRHDLMSDLHLGRTDIVGTGGYLITSYPFRSTFMRHKLTVAQRLPWITVGVRDEYERNLLRVGESDSLARTSYEFLDWEAFVQSPDTFKTRFKLSGGQRYEQAANLGALARSTVADAFSAGFGAGNSARHRVNTTFTYRQLRILDTVLTSQLPENTYLGRIDHSLKLGKGLATWDLFYEFGSGLEQRREFLYVEVPAGQGVYVWIDYNGNGIKELSEFEIANFAYEANYIRVPVPSNVYVRAYSNQFSASLDLRPGVKWGDAGGVRGFMGKFSDLASFRSDRRTGTPDVLQALDPFRIDPLDTLLTAFSSSVRNTLYYDRTSRVWSIDHTYQSDRIKTLLLNGYESRIRESNQVRVRWNTTQQWTADVEAEAGRTANNSDVLTSRVFAIQRSSVRPRITWRPNADLRAALSYKLTDQRNREELGGEQAGVQDLGLEVRWNTAGKGSVQLNVNLVDIRFDGEVSSPLGNELLQGLRPGTNATWGLVIQRKLSQNLQVDLSYNGRRSQGNPVVHVGGAQVRAFF